MDVPVPHKRQCPRTIANPLDTRTLLMAFLPAVIETLVLQYCGGLGPTGKGSALIDYPQEPIGPSMPLRSYGNIPFMDRFETQDEGTYADQLVVLED
jgi:hypothetical protein